MPERGNVVWLATPAAAGHEQSGRRPGYPFQVAVREGLPVDGVILFDQVKSLDWRARRAERACALPAELTAAVPARLGTLVAP